jgi:hypothetical protein
MADNKLSTSVAAEDDRALLEKAQEIAELFKRAVELGYSITFSPEQLKLLIAICEEGHLIKTSKPE